MIVCLTMDKTYLECRGVCKVLVLEWADFDEAAFKVSTITGGITNLCECWSSCIALSVLKSTGVRKCKGHVRRRLGSGLRAAWPSL